MNILVINCGSSSLKYQLLDMQGERVLASGLVERIGESAGKVSHSHHAETNDTKRIDSKKSI